MQFQDGFKVALSWLTLAQPSLAKSVQNPYKRRTFLTLKHINLNKGWRQQWLDP